MSRAILRTATDVCADCGVCDPTWASLNRGLLICDECCSIHRSLGRHISNSRSLKKGHWHPNQLAMVHQLVNSGANNIWEYTLLEPTQGKQAKRKPAPKDPVHPNKADFIRAKYQFLAFVNKQKDAEITCIDDISKQLHASVRTANLETSLRLLSVGADPNYFHPEKGTMPLHVAAQSGQALQIELLLIYGADPAGYDTNGKTPVEYATAEGYTDIAERLVESQYELTDRLTHFLCGKKPDHRNGQHFLIPEMADSSLDLSELARAAKKKLQALPNHLFEELAMDIYDEVDRRENEQIWQAGQSGGSSALERQMVPFLPVNPELSSTRNQGRQKLARFNAREFATLIIDVLNDAKRRQQASFGGTRYSTLPRAKGSAKLEELRPTLAKLRLASKDDNEPLYDSVAPDDDYASIEENQAFVKNDRKDGKAASGGAEGSERTPTPMTALDVVDTSELAGLEEAGSQALIAAQSEVQRLLHSNQDLRQELTLLHGVVQKLMQENESLRAARVGVPGRPSLSTASRPKSMIEASLMRQFNGLFSRPSERKTSGTSSIAEEEQSVTAVNGTVRDSSLRQSSSTQSSGGLSDATSGVISPTPVLDGASYPDTGDDMGLPAQDEVVRKTERITKRIQELLISAQQNKYENYTTCSEKICSAVADMVTIFPANIQDERINTALHLMTSGAQRLTDQCSQGVPDASGQSDLRVSTQSVIQCAYDIAKAAKHLVTIFE